MNWLNNIILNHNWIIWVLFVIAWGFYLWTIYKLNNLKENK